jgi:hypothetical protein
LLVQTWRDAHRAVWPLFKDWHSATQHANARINHLDHPQRLRNTDAE